MINDTDGRKAWLYFSHDKKFSILDEDAPNGEGEEITEEGVFLTLTEIAEINARQAEVAREAKGKHGIFCAHAKDDGFNEGVGASRDYLRATAESMSPVQGNVIIRAADAILALRKR